MPNKVVQEFNQKHFQPIKTWRVKSSHKNPDTGEDIFYSVEQWLDRTWTCQCMAGRMRRKCRHIRQCQDELAEEKYNK